MIFSTKPENLWGDVWCHELTIYKQFLTYTFINTELSKYTLATKKKTEKAEKAGLVASLLLNNFTRSVRL